MSVELLAVTAVIERIATCPMLAPEIASGDKTPVTDGHIDFYSSESHSTKTLVGRVPVQVKGRRTNAKVKASRDSQSFQVEREVLQFFRNHGGGIYFYVPMREGDAQRDVFYANLLPFKIDRLMEAGTEEQKTFALKLARLPAETSEIEKIVHLAWSGRTQSAVTGKNDHLLGEAERLTIHSLVGFDESRPTRLALSETDYVVVAHLPGGVAIAIDIDLEILPPEYIEQDLPVPISCGGVEFNNGSSQRLDENTFLVRLSEGLQIHVSVMGGKASTTLNVAHKGSLREQAKNFDFGIASAAGNPLVFGEYAEEPHNGDPQLENRMRAIRAELARLIELFDELGVDDALTSAIEIDHDTKRTLLALYEGIVQDRPVKGTSDGSGRYDIAVGPFKIMVIIMPAEDDQHRLTVDPFDPSKRDRYRIYRVEEGGAPESIEIGTVYEAVTPEDMARILNLRLSDVVRTYAQLEDREAASNLANLTLLRILSAADLTNEEHQRAYLFRGAIDLCTWLLEEDPDSLIHRINWWQIQYRLGALDDADRRDIRAARRSLNRGDRQAGQLEACLLLLIADGDELDLALSELSDDEVATLKTWPIWSLASSAGQAAKSSE